MVRDSHSDPKDYQILDGPFPSPGHVTPREQKEPSSDGNPGLMRPRAPSPRIST